MYACVCVCARVCERGCSGVFHCFLRSHLTSSSSKPHWVDLTRCRHRCGNVSRSTCYNHLYRTADSYQWISPHTYLPVVASSVIPFDVVDFLYNSNYSPSPSMSPSAPRIHILFISLNLIQLI